MGILGPHYCGIGVTIRIGQNSLSPVCGIFNTQYCVQVGVPHDESDEEESDSDEEEDDGVVEHYWWDCPYCKDIWLTEEERNQHLEICMER